MCVPTAYMALRSLSLERFAIDLSATHCLKIYTPSLTLIHLHTLTIKCMKKHPIFYSVSLSLSLSLSRLDAHAHTHSHTPLRTHARTNTHKRTFIQHRTIIFQSVRNGNNNDRLNSFWHLRLEPFQGEILRLQKWRDRSKTGIANLVS